MLTFILLLLLVLMYSWCTVYTRMWAKYVIVLVLLLMAEA